MYSITRSVEPTALEYLLETPLSELLGLTTCCHLWSLLGTYQVKSEVPAAKLEYVTAKAKPS